MDSSSHHPLRRSTSTSTSPIAPLAMAALHLSSALPSFASPLLPLFPLSPDLHLHHPPAKRRRPTSLLHSLPSAAEDRLFDGAATMAASLSSAFLRTKLLDRFDATALGDDATALGDDATALTLGNNADSAALVRRLLDRKLRVLFKKHLRESDVSPGQDRLLLGKRSQGCLGADNTPSAPEWRDVPLTFHDVEEMGRTWVLVHGFWPSSRAFILKGREWSKFRHHKRLQAKDIITISVDDTDGSLWISHRPTATPSPQVQRKQNVRSENSGLRLFPLEPDLQSESSILATAPRYHCPSPPQPVNFSRPGKPTSDGDQPRNPLGILDLNLGLPPSSNWYSTCTPQKRNCADPADCRASKRQQTIPAAAASPLAASAAPTDSSSVMGDTASECNSTCIINGGSTSEECRDGNCEDVDQLGTAWTLLALGRRAGDEEAAVPSRFTGGIEVTRKIRGGRGSSSRRELRVLFEKELTESDVSREQDRLLFGTRSRLGAENTPSAPEWRDVPLVLHDVEEMGRTWELVHGYWPSSRAYVLKGRQWSQFRAQKRLEAKDILTISVDDAHGGSVWISVRRRR